MTEKRTPPKKNTKQTKPEAEIQAGDQSIAVSGAVTDSAIIHGQTTADRFWRHFSPLCQPNVSPRGISQLPD